MSLPTAHLALELGILVGDQRRQVRHGTRINHSLCQVRGVLGNVTERRRCNALERQLRFLHAQHEKRHGACIHHLLRQLLHSLLQA